MKGAVLVTGSSGFLGRALVARLSVRPGVRLWRADLRPAAGVIPCDLADSEAALRLLRRVRPRFVFHAAGTVQRDALWRSHVDSTVRLLDAVRALPDAASVRVVIPGSSAEYGLAGGDGGPRSPRTRETDPAEPITPYGAAKLAQTLIALSYRHRGLDVRVARIFNILGPGMPESLSLGSFARQIARIERGLQPPRLSVGRLSAERDYVHVDDAARALCLLALRGRSGEVYNVCSGRLRSMRGLLDTLIALSTRRIAVVPDPRRMRGREVRRLAGDGRKLAAATGWRPRLAVDAALRETLDWHRRALA